MLEQLFLFSYPLQVYHVLKLAVGTMPGFVIYMAITLVSFALTAYLLFGRTSHQFRSPGDAMFTLFIAVLGYAGVKVGKIHVNDK